MTATATDLTRPVVLIDLSSIAHPLYHLTTADPNPDATAQQTVARVHALATGRDHVAVCCDSGKSFRKDLDATYKANRPERDEVLIRQITLAREALVADGFPVWAAPGFEADDLIASAASRLRALGHEVIVVSADKDMLQLVTDAAPTLKVKSLISGDVLDTEAVAVKMGVLPAQMQDYQSLTGDTSDNIKGAPGVGPKTAAGLLKQFGSLDEFYRLVDAGQKPAGVTPKLLQTLILFRARLPLVRMLVTLRVDAPVPVDDVLVPRAVPAMASEPEPGPEPAGELVDCEVVDDITYAMGPDDGPPLILPLAQETPTERAPEDAGKPVTGSTGPVIPDTVMPSQPTNKIARVSKVVDAEVVPYEKQLDPRTMGEAITLAKDMFLARNFPGAASPQTALATIMMGREMGLPAMTSLRTINVIEGRHSMSAQLIVGLVLKSKLVEYVEPVSISDTEVTYRAKRVGRPEVQLTHTIAMAETAGLLKDKSNWKKIPVDMLVSRCSVRICRIVAPDVCANVYTPEEIVEMKESANG